VLSVKLRDPQFEGQTKAKLGNPEARTATEAVVNEALKEFLEKHNLTNVEIQVDGGVKASNVKQVVNAGANIIVSGSGIFSGDIGENIKKIRKAVFIRDSLSDDYNLVLINSLPLWLPLPDPIHRILQRRHPS